MGRDQQKDVALAPLLKSSEVTIRAVLRGDEVVHVAEIPAGRSTRDMMRALGAAQRATRDLPEVVTRIDFKADRHSVAQLEAARQKRDKKAARRRILDRRQ